MVPADKAKKFTKRVSSVDPQLARELRAQGSYIETRRLTSYYCISCAIHSGKLQIRQQVDRKDQPKH
jgi:small subunit ribosomal protein S26e